MNRGFAGRIAAIVLVTALGLSATGAAQAAGSCDDVLRDKMPAVTAAYKYQVVDQAVRDATAAIEKAQPQPDKATRETSLRQVADQAKASTQAREISLGDIVTVEGNNFDSLFDKACAGRSVVLFLNEWPIADVTPLPPANPTDHRLNFKLVSKHRGTDTTPDTWLPILGKPGFGTIPVRVSVGFANGYAMPLADDVAAVILDFRPMPGGAFAGWVVIFLLMLVVFSWTLLCSNVLRDPAPNIVGGLGAYSLSRTQGAFWFFIILAAYLFIGLVTGDFTNSINSTALILLGIGAGTVLGSAAIDAQKDTDKAKADQAKAITDVRTQLIAAKTQSAALDQQIQAAHANIDGLKAAFAALAPGDAAARSQNATDQAAQDVIMLDRRTQKTAQVSSAENLQSQLDKLNGKSEGFIIDILSDANGISFHRFQIFVWTMVLGIIFILAVYENLAMPTFNTTLMGLLGLSAGTYLGLKIPEATTPTKTA